MTEALWLILEVLAFMVGIYAAAFLMSLLHVVFMMVVNSIKKELMQ